MKKRAEQGSEENGQCKSEGAVIERTVRSSSTTSCCHLHASVYVNNMVYLYLSQHE